MLSLPKIKEQIKFFISGMNNISLAITSNLFIYMDLDEGKLYQWYEDDDKENITN